MKSNPGCISAFNRNQRQLRSAFKNLKKLKSLNCGLQNCYQETIERNNKQSDDEVVYCTSSAEKSFQNISFYLKMENWVIYLVILIYYLLEVIFKCINLIDLNPSGRNNAYGYAIPMAGFISILAVCLLKIMDLRTFCIMNPFDLFCQRIEIDCTKMISKSIISRSLIDNNNGGVMEVNVDYVNPGLSPISNTFNCLFFLPKGTLYDMLQGLSDRNLV